MSSALQKPLGDMSLAELRRLIDQRIAAQVPPIPKQVQRLADLDIPLIAPDVPTDDTVLKYDGTRVTATKVTAAVLEAVMVLASTIVAGDPNAARIELGLDQTDPTIEGIRAFDDSDAQTFNVDAQDGSVYMKGRLDFGTGSRLAANDVVDLEGQPSAGFLTPVRVQRASISGWSGSDISSLTLNWPAPTTKGNTLLCIVTQEAASGTPTAPTLSGYSSAQTTTFASTTCRQTILTNVNAASQSGARTVNFGASGTRRASVQLLEYANVGLLDVTATAATGSSNAPATNSSGTLAQAGEMVVAAFGVANNANILIDTPTNGFSIWGSTAANDSGVGVKQTVSDLAVSATTAVSTAVTEHSGSARAWVAQLITIKADAAGVSSVGTPDTGKVRAFAAQNATGHPILHGIDDAGNANSYVMGPGGVGYRMEVLSASFTPGSTAAFTAGAGTVTLSGVQAGDFVIWIGSDTTGDGLRFHYWVRPALTTTNQATVEFFNTDNATRNPASANHYFLVIHSS